MTRTATTACDLREQAVTRREARRGLTMHPFGRLEGSVGR